MNATFTAYAVSDLYHAGYTEDGESFVAEVYYVVIENNEGLRFRHESSFPSTEALTDDEGDFYFSDLREEASAKAERLADRVNAALQAGKGIDKALWREVDPAYGSDAYIAQGTEAYRAYQDRFAD
jgi:hypothetical protein